jgi:methylmalonyl-CoA mutase
MFPKPSFEDWKNKAIADLKGKDFEKTLVWQSPEGIPVQPIYTDVAEESTQLIQLKHRGWEIVEPVKVTEAAIANRTALLSLEGGATSIFFDIQSEVAPEKLFKNILLDIAPVYIKGCPETSGWRDYLNKHNNTLLRPLINLLEKVNQGDFSSIDVHSIPYPEVLFFVDAGIFKESGGSIIHEIGYAIASLQEQLHLLSSKGKNVDKVQEIIIQTAVGNHYFFEIAKIRALRRMAQKVIESYGDISLKIIASSANLHISNTDIHTNILRLTTAAMSAVLGKSDGVMLLPFEETEQTRRITRNIHHLLMEESHFHQFADPAAGSYYISHLTKNFMDAAWQLFLDTEKHGGYIASMEKGIVQQVLNNHRKLLERDIATRKNILLGVNQFPNLSAPPTEIPHQEGTQSVKGIHPVRLAEPFERLRLSTEQFIAAGHPRPLAFLLKFGNPVISNARATWSLNFLACAGIASIESNADTDAAIEQLQSSGAQIIVLCSDNDSWSEKMPEILSAVPENTIKLLAGKGDVEGIHACIYEGCDVLSVLQFLLKKLGVSA